MSIYGQLTLGLYPLYQTYDMINQITYRIPQNEGGQILEEVPFPQNDLMRQRWNEMGLREDTRVFLSGVDSAPVEVKGSHLSPYSDVAFYCNRVIWEALSNSREFALLTSAHMAKSNACLKANLIALITNIACTFLIKDKFPTWTTLLVSTMLAEYARGTFIRYQVDKADIYAINNIITPVVGLVQPRDVLEDIRQVHIQSRQFGLLNRLMYSEEGDDRLNFFSPSITHRIQRLDTAIAQQTAAQGNNN